jgi:cobalt-zinc-cadmium efflux system protein
VSHDHQVSAAARSKGRLAFVLALTAAFTLVEGVAGLLTDSLVLLADAGHMLTDVIGLSLALLSIQLATRPATARKTYGYYRLEILAALFNAMILIGVALFILFEAYRRFQSPPEIASVPLLVVASIGLVVNLIGAGLLLSASNESLNVRGAFLEVISDLLASVAAVVAGLVLLTTGWRYADPLFAAGIGLFILPRTWNLLKSSLDVLLEGTPSSIPVDKLQDEVLAVKGIVGLHDLHIWMITSGFIAMSGHAVVLDGEDRDRILVDATTRLHNAFAIEHVTLQLESASAAAELQQPCIPGLTVCYTDSQEVLAEAGHGRDEHSHA